ncbi:MAG: patatin-like phospholipase family protein [Deltaproteobacteria bacterium]|jgi:NTE family protein|nr:patatin-like phospholipase family protein [Deltaproteobacteria bacterium]
MDATKKPPSKIGVAFSSGFFGFFAHAGFLAAIRESGMIPSAYAGASSGAIVAAMAATGMRDSEIREMLFGLKKRDFWDPDPWHAVLSHALRLFRGYTGYLRGDGFARLLEGLPARKFEECDTPLAISATDLTRKKEAVFTSGDLVKAIQASGSVPVLFKPLKLNGSLYLDGGITGKAPLEALVKLCKLDTIVVHFIASDNVEEAPHAFLKKRFTPWHIHHLAVNIARQKAYQMEIDLVRSRGVAVREIKTETLTMGPGNLEQGPEAYERAKASALKTLSE